MQQCRGHFRLRKWNHQFRGQLLPKPSEAGGQSFANIVHSGAGVLQLVSNPPTVTTSLRELGRNVLSQRSELDHDRATFSNPGTVQFRGTETVTGLTQDVSQGT